MVASQQKCWPGSWEKDLAVYFCAYQVCFSHDHCAWTGQAGNQATSKTHDLINSTCLQYYFFLNFKTNIEKIPEIQTFCMEQILKQCLKCTHQKNQRRAWMNATSPSVQQTAQSLMAPHLISYSFFCCFWLPSLAKYSGDCFFFAWPHVLHLFSLS